MIFENIKDEKLLNELKEAFIGRVDETGATLKRMMSFVKEGKDFGIISAFRSSYSYKENTKRNRELLQELRNLASRKEIGAYKLVGHWKECSEPLKDGEGIEDCKGKIIDALEESWFIIKPDDIDRDEFDGYLQKLAREYDQDAYIIGNNKEVLVKLKDGTVFERHKGFTEKNIKDGITTVLLKKQGYSEFAKLRKKGKIKPFAFENFGVVVPKDNISSKMAFSILGIKY